MDWLPPGHGLTRVEFAGVERGHVQTEGEHGRVLPGPILRQQTLCQHQGTNTNDHQSACCVVDGWIDSQHERTVTACLMRVRDCSAVSLRGSRRLSRNGNTGTA